MTSTTTTAIQKANDASLDARFKGFREADVMGVRRYIEAGSHVLLIKRTDQGASRNTEKTKTNKELQRTVIEFKVVATELLPGYEYIEGDPKKKGWVRGPLGASLGEAGDFRPMAVGESCSMAETSENQGYFGNVLAFVAGVLGMGIDEMKNDPAFNDIFLGVFSPAQILAGQLVRCVAQQVPTTSAKAKSKVYTAKTFEAIHANDYQLYGIEPIPSAYGYQNPDAASPPAAAADAATGEGGDADAEEGSESAEDVSASA
jgi:hypothetical protein